MRNNLFTEFFARLSLVTCRDALTTDQARQLSAATLFCDGVPIPRDALEAAGAAYGVEQAGAALARLLALGLIDDWGKLGAVAHVGANPLARPLAKPLEPEDRPRLCKSAWPLLLKAWRDAEGAFPDDHRAVVAAEIAIDGGATPEAVEAAAFAGAAWLARANQKARVALELIVRALSVLPPGHSTDPGFLRLGVECAALLGEGNQIDRLLLVPSRSPTDEDPSSKIEHAALELRRAERLIQLGELENARRSVLRAVKIFQAAGEERMSAVAAGTLADMLQSRGLYEAAASIRENEQLPILERLFDLRAVAITKAKIANLLGLQGYTAKARTILSNDVLPAFQKLQDKRAIAITRAKIANMLFNDGQTKEAIYIIEKQVIPPLVELGDLREVALAKEQLADIHESISEYGHALRLREEIIPILEALDEKRSVVIIRGKIADIYQAQGHYFSALKVRLYEELPTYEVLEDAPSIAATKGRIAELYLHLNRLMQAKRIQTEALDIYRRLPHPVGVVAGLLGIGRIALAMGTQIEAKIALEEAWQLAIELARPDAITQIGQLLAPLLNHDAERSKLISVLESTSFAFRRLGKDEIASEILGTLERLKSSLH